MSVDEPVARLWHATTVLREHRGDGHIAALVAAGVDGCEALVLRVARGPAGGAGPGRELLQPARGWTDDERDAAAGRLASRGWLDGAGAVTPAVLAAALTPEPASPPGRPARNRHSGTAETWPTMIVTGCPLCFAANRSGS